MRIPTYKVGWIIPAKVAALTHFHSNITEEDRMGVFTETQKLLESVQEPFHIIIDNRYAPLERFYNLKELQAFSPFLNHPQLRSLFIVKPVQLELNQVAGAPEKSGEVVLINVDSVTQALAIMSKMVEGMDEWEAKSFFPHSERNNPDDFIFQKNGGE